MRVAVLVADDGGVTVYTDAPADVIVVDQSCPPDMAEDDRRSLVVNEGEGEEEWLLEGGFFKNDAAVDPAFVDAIFNEQENGSPPEDDDTEDDE